MSDGACRCSPLSWPPPHTHTHTTCPHGPPAAVRPAPPPPTHTHTTNGSHYPERLGAAVCFHAPTLFSLTWKVGWPGLATSQPGSSRGQLQLLWAGECVQLLLSTTGTTMGAATSQPGSSSRGRCEQQQQQALASRQVGVRLLRLCACHRLACGRAGGRAHSRPHRLHGVFRVCAYRSQGSLKVA